MPAGASRRQARPPLRPLRAAVYAAGAVGGAPARRVVPRGVGGALAGGRDHRRRHPVGCPWLVVLWVAGLVAHTMTLTAALPGLTHRRALLLSLTGSAVANVLPLGGAAGWPSTTG